MESLDPKVVWYWRLAAIPRMLPGLIMGVLVASVLPRTGRMSPQVTLTLVVVGGIAAIALWNIVSAGLRFRRFQFQLTGNLLHVQHGIILRKEKIIPIDRMQHLDVDHGPIERLFGLARLSVFTAGGRTATFQLPGLSRERADSLRAHIVQRRDELVMPSSGAAVSQDAPSFIPSELVPTASESE